MIAAIVAMLRVKIDMPPTLVVSTASGLGPLQFTG